MSLRLFRRLRRFLCSIPDRASGSFLPSNSDNVVRLRYNAPTGRKLIEDQPDTFVQPVDYDRLPP